MYTHRFPGVITHTSLSKRVLPETTTNNAGKEAQDAQQQQQQQRSTTTTPPSSSGQSGRESIRLAVVYKVVQAEHVTYHTRVYHFGVFQRHTGLRGKAPSP